MSNIALILYFCIFVFVFFKSIIMRFSHQKWISLWSFCYSPMLEMMNILYMYSIKSTVAFIDEMVLGMYFIYPSSFVWRMITSSQSLWTNLPIAPYIDCSEQWYLSVFVHAMECKSASVYNTSTDHDGSNFFCNLLIPYPSTVLHSNRPMISGIMILPLL